ncbi:MAG TPA: hypothetical protein VEL47_07555 [Myxococcota bacterium]|nr:hypothetical protein [Myxococcota bacterium]
MKYQLLNLFALVSLSTSLAWSANVSLADLREIANAIYEENDGQTFWNGNTDTTEAQRLERGRIEPFLRNLLAEVNHGALLQALSEYRESVRAWREDIVNFNTVRGVQSVTASRMGCEKPKLTPKLDTLVKKNIVREMERAGIVSRHETEESRTRRFVEFSRAPTWY